MSGAIIRFDENGVWDSSVQRSMKGLYEFSDSSHIIMEGTGWCVPRIFAISFSGDFLTLTDPTDNSLTKMTRVN